MRRLARGGQPKRGVSSNEQQRCGGGGRRWRGGGGGAGHCLVVCWLGGST